MKHRDICGSLLALFVYWNFLETFTVNICNFQKLCCTLLVHKFISDHLIISRKSTSLTSSALDVAVVRANYSLTVNSSHIDWVFTITERQCVASCCCCCWTLQHSTFHTDNIIDILCAHTPTHAHTTDTWVSVCTNCDQEGTNRMYNFTCPHMENLKTVMG